MAADITSDDFVARSSDVHADEQAQLEAALAQAMAEVDRIREKASVDNHAADPTADYSKHDVEGVGRYVIPRKLGWKPLLKIIHDPAPNIDFSAKIYPAFDAIVGEHFNSPFLLDPLDDKYESYESLRDNLAAVRNFLMESYYAEMPVGMTPVMAKQALAEIAAFVGDGLYNNWLFLGLVPNHKPGEPHIELKEARKPGGVGAQYIYDEILKHQRHSSWLRPFDAVITLLGGKPTPDWKLPASDATHFADREGHEIAASTAIASESIEAASARVNAIEARLAAIRDAKAISTTATDLDAIGNHLLYTAENMEGVAQLDEGKRRKAVSIAKDILRQLKISIGDLNVVDGLQMKPSDDLAVLGGVRGVAMTYERLLAWARGNNDSAILQHPSILAATQAIGQLGYLAKVEGLRMARIAGNNVLIDSISEQLKRIPESYAKTGNKTFGELLDTVEHGIDTVINRIQQVSVSGAKIGKSVDNVGTSMDAPPTAGNANLVGNNKAAELNAQLIAAQQLAAMAQANRSTGQTAPARSAQSAPAVGSSGTAPAMGRSTTTNQITRARQQQQRTAAASSSTNPADHHGPTPLTPAQLAAMSNSAAARAAKAAHDQEEAHHHDVQQLQLREAQLRAAKAAALKAAAAKVDLKGFSMKGVTGNGDMLKPGRNITPAQVMKPTAKSQMQTPAATPTPAAPANPNEPYDPLKQPHSTQPTPPGRGSGRGF